MASYGSVSALELHHRPSRRKKVLFSILAVASVLFFAALVFSGNTLIPRGQFSDLLGTRQAIPKSDDEVSQSGPKHQPDSIANWGNQTPTAKIYALNSPVRDGVIDFYFNFPSGSSKLRAPNWFMGIPVHGRGKAALKQVEVAFFNGQINEMPVSSTASHPMNRKLLMKKKFASKPKKVSGPSSATASQSFSSISGKSKTAHASGKDSSSQASDTSGDSSSSGLAPVNCCLPSCAQAPKISNLFNGCQKCSSKQDKDQCANVMQFKKVGGFQACRKLAGPTGTIKPNNVLPQFFDAKQCSNFGGTSQASIQNSIPLPVPACAIDRNSKFAGCSACANIKEYPAEDSCICDIVSSKSKLVVGVTVVVRSDQLTCPKLATLATSGSTSSQTSLSNKQKSSATSPSTKQKSSAKVCSHDANKLNGNGQGCSTCQGKRITPATQDTPGNDYWACSQCRDKNICNFNCKLNTKSKVWECTTSNSESQKTESPSSQPEPQCMTDTKLNWKSSPNMNKCQGFMCRKAGLLSSGEFGRLPYPKVNSYPKSLNTKDCCPFLAQGLTPASCHSMYGCEVPLYMKDSKSEWDMKDQVQSCKNFFCLQGVSSPAVWSQKKGDSKFADGKNKGRSTCCEKLLASVPDGKETWCPSGPIPMDVEECKSFLCQQEPMIFNSGDSYFLWEEQHRSFGSRNILALPPSPSKKMPSSSLVNEDSSKGATIAASTQPHPASKGLDPNVGTCVRLLELSGIHSWETSQHCITEEDTVIEEKDETKESEDSEGNHPVANNPEANHPEADHPEADHPEAEEVLEHDEIKSENIPGSECSEEGPADLPLLPGADVLGYTYDPDFGMADCNFDRCVMRPFIKFTFKDCKVVETPAGQFKVPDQIYAANLFETTAKTHIYANEKEEKMALSVEAKISGSYGAGSAAMSMSMSQSGDSSSKQHVAVRKIDVHLYRLTLLSSPTFDHLRPEFVDAFKSLPARFEDNAHEYLQFAREWGRYVPSSGTFGGSLEIKMKFFSGSSNKKEDFSLGVEAAYDSGMFSVAGSASAAYSKESKEIEDKNEISIDSSGGDPAVAASIADLKSPEEMNFREDVEKWLVSLPRFPRLVEDWPVLSVITKFIPNSPSSDGFDPFTRKQALLQALRILHDVDTKRFFDTRKCTPPFSPPPPPLSDPIKESAAKVATKDAGDVIAVPGKKVTQNKGVVQIFHHMDYQGKQLGLGMGNYDCDQLRDMGFDWVRSISSVKVDQNYIMYVYELPGFQGASGPLTGSQARLNDWNDRIMSFRVVNQEGMDASNHWQSGENKCHSFEGQAARKIAAAQALADQIAAAAKAKADSEARIQLINSRKKKPLPSGKDSIGFNDYDRMNVGQCLSFDAMSNGGIYVYMFSSPVSQSDAFSFHVGTSEVKFEKGFSGTVIKKTDDTNALAYGQSQLSQNVWFCVYPDADDKSITVFSYGRGSHTLFEVTQKDPVTINYFALDCSREAFYRNIAVIKASRLLDTVSSFNRACKIMNCERSQESESESGNCACEKCEFGYQPHNNNQECVVADECIAQFGCLTAEPPLCTCEECCCGLSYDPATNNCINANLVRKPGDGNMHIEPNGLQQFSTGYVNKMSTKFQLGSSYRLKKLMLSCTETNVQNIRVSYDTSKPALGFVDYDSTHLIKNSEAAGKFDFSLYDNLRKSISANPLYSASGFLNLDEVKLEQVSLTSMAKNAGNSLKETFKFLTEGAQQFAKDFEKNVEDVKNTATQLVIDVKAKTEEIVKVADVEFKKFMKAADKVYKDVVSTAQKVSQGAVDFISQNADLLKTVNGIAGGVGAALVTALPQLMNAIPGCQAWCGILVAAVGNAAVGAATSAGNGLIDLAVNTKASGTNPLAFLSSDLKNIPSDIMAIAGPILNKATKSINSEDIKNFANSNGLSDIMNSVSKGGLNDMKDVFNDPGIQKIGGDLISQSTSLLGNIAGGDVSKSAVAVATSGLSAVSPFLDKLVPGSGSILKSASASILPGLTNILGGLFKKRSLLSTHDHRSSDSMLTELFFKGLGDFATQIAHAADKGFKEVGNHVQNVGEAVKSQVSKSVETIGNVHKAAAGHLDSALGTSIFSEASNHVHNVVGGTIKGFVNGLVDGVSGAVNGVLNTIGGRIQSILDPNKSKRDYMNSQEYKDKMAAKDIFQKFQTKLDLPSNMPKFLTDSIVQWIIGEMKVTPLGKQPFLTNLNADDQCVRENGPETCTDDDIKCIVLANKCFLDDEECVRAALKTVTTASLEKYAAKYHLEFPGNSYGRYIRFSAPACKKRTHGDSDAAENLDADTLFANQPVLTFGLTSKFWQLPWLISSDSNEENRIVAGSRLSRGMRIRSPNGQCRAEVQTDGNFVVYQSNNQPIWDTKTSDIFVLFLQANGNLCAYRADGSIAWGCGLGMNVNTHLALQDDCNLVLYNGGGKAVWASGVSVTSSHHTLNVQNQIARQLIQVSRQLIPGDKTILSDVRETVFKSAKPIFEGQVANLNFAQTNTAFAGSRLASDFLAQFSGGIFVPISGSWTFYLKSDDGSRLYIDGSQVIDNDGFHGMIEKSGSVILSRGMHTIDVSFFQGSGGAGLELAWSGPGTAKHIIPTQYFLLNSQDIPLSIPQKSNTCNMNNNLQISQLAIFDPFGDNVALGIPCHATNVFSTGKLIPYLPASSSNVLLQNASTCSRAVDGNLINRNGDEIFQSIDPDSDIVTFDLGKDVLIKRVMFWNRKDCCQSMIAGATLEIIATNGEVLNVEVLDEKLVQVFDFPASQSRATLFTNCQYGGDQVALAPGNYKLAMMQIPKNSLSSIKIPNNLEIKLFQGENFDGKSTPWMNADIPCLGSGVSSVAFDDQTGSVQVRERSKLKALNKNEVVFYDTCDFKGNSMALTPGDYSASQMTLTKNSIMSLMIPSELEVQLYSFDNAGGRSSGWLQKSFACLTDIDFSRTTVSLEIRKRTQNRKLLSDDTHDRENIMLMVLPHAARHAFYMPKNGDSRSAKKVLQLAVEIAHSGALAITESHMHHVDMLSSIAKWVPHQYVLSALKMDVEQNSATSAFSQTAITRVHKSLFTRLNEIADTAAELSLNVLDQTVVNILGEAYAPVTLPPPCFSRELIMSYLPTGLSVGINTWIEAEKFSYIQEIRVDSVDALLKDPSVVQSEKYSIVGLSFKISQYNADQKKYHLVRGIETVYKKIPAFGGPGDVVKTFIGKSQPDTKDPVVITDCKSIEFKEGEFLIGMSVVTLPEGLAGINSVLTNTREIVANCGQQASSDTDMTSDDGVTWMYCDAGYDAVGIGGKFDSRVMRTVEMQCSPTNQADRVQFLGVYSYSFKTDEFFNGIGANRPGFRSGYWAAGQAVGITRQLSNTDPSGWDLRIWTNRVPTVSPVTGLAPVGIASTSTSHKDNAAKANADYRRISKSDDLVVAMAPPTENKWFFDYVRVHFTDISRLSFVEDTQEGTIKGVYVEYSARPDLYAGFMLNKDVNYKNLRIKSLKLERNEYWTGLKVGLDPITGAVSCITGVKTSVKEHGILCGSRNSACILKAGWIDCPSNTPMMVALQEDFNSQNALIGIMPICASLKTTRFNVNDFTVMLEEDEYINQMTVVNGDWLDAISGISTNKRNIPLQCGLMTRPPVQNLYSYTTRPGSVAHSLTLPGQYLEKKVKKSKAVVGFEVSVNVDDQFGVFADEAAIDSMAFFQRKLTPKAAQQLVIARNDIQQGKGPGPTIIAIKLISVSFDADPQSAIILQTPEEVGRSRIPDFYSSGVYHQLTFDMAFDFYKSRLAQFQQIHSFEFQCERSKSTAKDFWMPWFQFSFTSGENYPRGKKSTERLAVSKILLLSAEEYMTRIELSSHKDKGYAITSIRTNKKPYFFRCGETAVSLDVPPGKKHLFIGLAGNLQTAADSTFFTNLQGLHLKLNEFTGEPGETKQSTL